MKPTRVKTLHFKPISVSRSSKGNAVAALAYRSGFRLQDERTKEHFDYRNRDKHGTIIARWISAPDGKAPQWLLDAGTEREQWLRLGNEIEKVENSHNRRASAELLKDFQAAAPRELNHEQNIALARRFEKRFHEKGLLVAVGYHEQEASDGGLNPHFHFGVPMRTVSQEGFGKKYRGLSGTWFRKENPEFMELRRSYFECVNHALREAGIEGVYYDPEKQPDKEPQEHIGKKSHAMKGRARDRAEEIRERNRETALQNHVQIHARRIASPEWKEKQEEFQNRRRARGSSMAARDAAQRSTQLDKSRGRKTLDIAVDRALRTETWQQRTEREREMQKQRERVPDL